MKSGGGQAYMIITGYLEDEKQEGGLYKRLRKIHE